MIEKPLVHGSGTVRKIPGIVVLCLPAELARVILAEGVTDYELFREMALDGLSGSDGLSHLKP